MTNSGLLPPRACIILADFLWFRYHFGGLIHQKTPFVERQKAFFVTMCSAARNVMHPAGVMFAAPSDVRFAREKRNTSHHFAAKPYIIIILLLKDSHFSLLLNIEK